MKWPGSTASALRRRRGGAAGHAVHRGRTTRASPGASAARRAAASAVAGASRVARSAALDLKPVGRGPGSRPARTAVTGALPAEDAVVLAPRTTPSTGHGNDPRSRRGLSTLVDDTQTQTGTPSTSASGVAGEDGRPACRRPTAVATATPSWLARPDAPPRPPTRSATSGDTRDGSGQIGQRDVDLAPEAPLRVVIVPTAPHPAAAAGAADLQCGRSGVRWWGIRGEPPIT